MDVLKEFIISTRDGGTCYCW